MIFVTVGTDVPFDRMVRAVDEWAGMKGRSDVFAQIGNTTWTPQHLKHTRFLRASEFTARLKEATTIVAHAGMGSILSALYAGKPILVMPRRAVFRETRNDHQVATARHLLELGKVAVAFDEHELRSKLDQLETLQAGETISRFASPELIAALQKFIRGEPLPDGAPAAPPSPPLTSRR